MTDLGSRDESPLERFKRITGATLRAISEEPEITVSFAPSGQGMVGKEARLTAPGRDLADEERSLARGEADAIALRLRYHDEARHARRRPGAGGGGRRRPPGRSWAVPRRSLSDARKSKAALCEGQLAYVAMRFGADTRWLNAGYDCQESNLSL